MIQIGNKCLHISSNSYEYLSEYMESIMVWTVVDEIFSDLAPSKLLEFTLPALNGGAKSPSINVNFE